MDYTIPLICEVLTLQRAVRTCGACPDIIYTGVKGTRHAPTCTHSTPRPQNDTIRMENCNRRDERVVLIGVAEDESVKFVRGSILVV